jgi:hypothetical protein
MSAERKDPRWFDRISSFFRRHGPPAERAALPGDRDPPDAIAGADDLGGWKNVAPEQLMLDPALRFQAPPPLAAAMALAYARTGGSAAYDEIGFRLSAATPCKGPVPLQTVQGMRLARERDEATQPTPALKKLLREEALLRHRPIDLPGTGHFSYRREGNFLHIVRPRSGSRVPGDEEVWTFPLSGPPFGIMDSAEPRDAPLITAQRYEVDVPGAYWLPLSLLIERGRMEQMQTWRDHLGTRTTAGRFYCFVSHRWLSPTHPDPRGLQASLIAWQMAGYMAEAIRVAYVRGLDEPRRFHGLIGCSLGPAGSELAEALVVNVLRMALDPTLLERAWEEIEGLDALDDNGVAAAAADAGLANLRALLEPRPVLTALLTRIYLWYDYGCMPQPPRTPEDEKVFRDGLEHLAALQILGRTAILLDEAEDYLSRGWCTLEATVADTVAGYRDLLVGAVRRTTSEGVTEHYFDMLLEDRPHILWRAVLDTEIFRLQTPEQCMARLELGVTEPRDVPFIYQGFVNLRAPRKIHVDDSELVTGVFPLPVLDDATVLIPRTTGQNMALVTAPRTRRTLDWTDAVRLRTGWVPGDSAADVPALLRRDPPPAGPPSCHVAVVASCEGEAVLLANWAWRRREELEEAVGAQVASLSWLATDIAPVGHLVDGTLRAMPIRAEVWVVVTMSTRLLNCSLTNSLLNTLSQAEVRWLDLSVDVPEDNLREIVAAGGVPREPESFAKLASPSSGFPLHPGGLFRGPLLEHLV